MAKFTDAVRNTLITYFNAGDQPTEAQFTALITRIQEGIEEHDHAGTGDGDGVNNLIGPVGVNEAAPGERLSVTGHIVVEGDDGFDAAGEIAAVKFGASDSGTNTTGVVAKVGSGIIFDVYKVAGGGELGANSLDAMFIEETTGKVVIGSLVTGAKFTVHCGAFDGIRIDSTGEPYFALYIGGVEKTVFGVSTGANRIIAGDVANDLVIVNRIAAKLLLATNNLARLIISAAGVVKIPNLGGVGQRDVRVNADGTLVAV